MDKLPLITLTEVLEVHKLNFQPPLEVLKVSSAEFLPRVNSINLLMMEMLLVFKRLFKSLQVMTQFHVELKSHIFLMF
jgi:hypothetical protein